MFNLGVLISGSGTTLQSIIDAIHAKELRAKIAIVIANHEDAYGLVRAKSAGIPTYIVSTSKRSSETYSAEIFALLQKHQVQLAVMAGFLRKYLPASQAIATINIHPSLLPSFGGKGMYGHHVHQAVKDYGCKVSGCTVHFVTDEYDTGPIIAQEALAVTHEDSVDTIAKNVQALEKKVLLKVLQKFSENKIQVDGRSIQIL